jgi:hypothetical protein
MSKKTATATAPKPISYEDSLIIEGLRKLALQRDTLVKYAKADEDEERTEELSADIIAIRHLLAKLGDTKALVLKSERKPKGKKTAKGKTKAKGVKVERKTTAKITKTNEAGEAIEGTIELAELLGA